MSAIIRTYDYLFKEAADPRVYNWPLMSNPWELMGLITIYLYAIYVYLPEYMKHKTPYKLTNVIKMYNVYQLIVCPVIIYGILTSGWTTNYTMGCQPTDYSDDQMAVRMARYVWWHMIVRISELIETVMFVLRKKYNQVSPLHVYHHTSTIVMAWLICKYSPGGMVTFTLIVNPFVHILMYTYYLLSSFGPEIQKKLDKFKPVLTAVQLVQLTIILLHSLQILLLPSCNASKAVKFISFVYVPNMLIIIGFFIKFYVQSYTKPKKSV